MKSERKSEQTRSVPSSTRSWLLRWSSRVTRDRKKLKTKTFSTFARSKIKKFLKNSLTARTSRRSATVRRKRNRRWLLTTKTSSMTTRLTFQQSQAMLRMIQMNLKKIWDWTSHQMMKTKVQTIGIFERLQKTGQQEARKRVALQKEVEIH